MCKTESPSRLTYVNIPRSNGGREGERLGKYLRNANLFNIQIGIRSDDGTSSVIDTFAHHVHSEKTLLPLDYLSIINELN